MAKRMTIYPSTRQVRLDDGPLIGPLTTRFWGLLAALSNRALWPTVKLGMEVWPTPSGDLGITEESVYQAVSQLREKLGDASVIRTYPRAGYMLSVEELEVEGLYGKVVK